MAAACGPARRPRPPVTCFALGLCPWIDGISARLCLIGISAAVGAVQGNGDPAPHPCRWGRILNRPSAVSRCGLDASAGLFCTTAVAP